MLLSAGIEGLWKRWENVMSSGRHEIRWKRKTLVDERIVPFKPLGFEHSDIGWVFYAFGICLIVPLTGFVGELTRHGCPQMMRSLLEKSFVALGWCSEKIGILIVVTVSIARNLGTRMRDLIIITWL